MLETIIDSFATPERHFPTGESARDFSDKIIDSARLRRKEGRVGEVKSCDINVLVIIDSDSEYE
jgi:hypothetical protein